MKLTKESIVRSLKNPSSAWQTTLLVTLAASAYLYRALPYFLKPQLYAEDGVLWLSEARNERAKTLIPKAYAGFLHFPERLFSYLVAHLPLLWAPSIYAYTAWGLFTLMTYYLLSSRTKILTKNFERIFMVLCLCLIANFREFFFNFSNSIFLMGIIGALILVAEVPKNRLVRIAEKLFFLLTCLALPFAWMYVPIVLFDRIKYKAKNNYFLVVSILGSIAQIVAYMTSHNNNTRAPVTFTSLVSKWTFLELYNQIVIPAVRFARIDIGLSEYHSHYAVLVVGLTMLSLLAATIVVLRKSNKQLWFFLFFLVGMTFASIKSPTLNVKTAVDALKTMSVDPGGNRYFVYGIIAVNVIFVKASYKMLSAKVRYGFMAFFIAFGLVTSIHYLSFHVDKGWQDYTAQYTEGIRLYNAGAKRVIIPVNPTPWTMGLFR